jgi:hypothetical protein
MKYIISSQHSCVESKIQLELLNSDEFSKRNSSKYLKNNRNFILKAVKQNGNSLKYASEKLQNYKEIVLEAVRQDGFSLKYAL